MKKERCYVVYMHKFPNNKVYIGLTKQSIEQRWGMNGCGYKRQPVYDAIQQYGWDNIEHIIVRDNLTYLEAQELEKALIEQHDSIDNGYNTVKGGGLGGQPWVTFEYCGKRYTAEELAQLSLNGITSHDLTTRINHHGWDISDALNTPKMKKDYKYEHNGKQYTAKELAEISGVEGITDKDILCRVNKHGWDVQRAITQPKNVKKQPQGVGDRIYEYNGKMCNSYELWQLRNVDELTVFDITNRINHHGWSVEKAISQPKKRQNQMFEYEGQLYTSHELANIAKTHGIEGLTHHNITDRINRQGWSVYKAITTPKASQKK